MGRRGGSVDRWLQKGMAAAGMVLMLLIFGKAIGMADIGGNLLGQGGERNKAAQCLMQIWRYSYPAGKISRQAGTLKPEPAGGWSYFLWSWNPVFRYLAKEHPDTGEYREPDPAYETYLSNQLFYEEHHYLAKYGGEESNQQSLPQEMEPPPLAPEKLQTAAVGLVGSSLLVTGTQYVMEQLADYDFLMKHFYSVHTSTTATRQEMDANVLLGKDLSMVKDSSKPQILIYHTHSQESFSDYGPDNPNATVVGMGSYLTELLEAKGYNVIHHTGVYDLVDGKLDRSKAYTYSLDAITRIIQENPSIEVVLDLHRDGVKEGLHLVSEVNGKPTAPLMFFNGMSQTPTETIEYLPNPYKEDNLAFSLKMQLDAAAYYPGLTRKIYLKGLRYNLHLRPKSALVEVGAQTNTYQEALNAMEPLSELLDMVLQGN